MNAPDAIVVTGIGVRAPCARDVEAFWSNALAGTVATQELIRVDTSRLSATRGGEVTSTVEGDDGDPLVVRLAVEVARMAVRDAGLSPATVAYERVGVCFGTVMGTRPGVERWLTTPSSRRAEAADEAWASPSLLSQAPARELGFGGPNYVIATACAAGNSAIAQGVDLLRARRADAMVVGGADELSLAMLMMFDSFRLLAPDAVRPFDRAREGLLLGEGAAALVLEREADARARRARVHGRVLGHANVADAIHITAPHPEGRGAIRAMRRALAHAGVEAKDVDHVSAHGTGTPANDAVEAQAIRTVLGGAADATPVTALKSMLGHAQGAASAIEGVGCMLAIRDGLIPPVANHETRDPACDIDVVVGRAREAPVQVALSNAFGFGGNIECVVFGAP
ncbi:MAG TPA: beta-ketoacyl-[acyl-carrier-protein] synthase family protein [Conexibacter sp.]|nr:beta-ketoacyl-[acyl-carrier-protein] synthase family protein [Conexibacter sp.]